MDSMFSAGRLFRMCIFLLGCLFIWRMWGYISGDPGLMPVLEKENNALLKMHNNDPLSDNAVAAPRKVQLKLYYEALCPDSKNFVLHQLAPAYQKIGSDYIALGFIPYGKARTHEKDRKLTFTCQHGKKECEANKIHACVIRFMKDEATQLNVISCMIENNLRPLDVGKRCVEEYGGNWSEVEKCSTTAEGDLVLKLMGGLTDDLDPPVTFIPTITLDGSQARQQKILKNLIGEICQLIKIKPAGCS